MKSNIMTSMDKNLYHPLCLTAGMALPFAFAPFSIHPLGFLSPSILLFSWLKFHNKPKESFFLGGSFGVGFFAVGVSWVYVSIHTYGQAPTILASTITILFIAVLALFPACNGYLFNRLCPENSLTKILLFFPACWVLLEWARSRFFTGFPWLFLGYSQIDSPLKNIAPIFGVYGVTFAVAFTSAAIVSFFVTKNNFYKITILAAMIALWFGSANLGHIEWTKPKGEKVRVSLIQGNIPLTMKWDAKKIPNILKLYQQLSEQNWQSKLIVWPEAAIPALRSQITNYLHPLTKEAKKHHTTIVSGILYRQEENGKYYNAMIAFGTNKSLYLKKHLVPFGEFLPFKSYLTWLLNYLHIPWSDFSAGAKTQPKFVAGDLKIAPFICYEITYPNLVLNYLPNAQLLLTISEDSWFGRSLAAAQQLEMAQMRSLETGRYQLAVANSGLTAIIDPKGNIKVKLPSFRQAVLNGEIHAMNGATPWVVFGHYLWSILTLVCFGIGILNAHKH